LYTTPKPPCPRVLSGLKFLVAAFSSLYVNTRKFEFCGSSFLKSGREGRLPPLMASVGVDWCGLLFLKDTGDWRPPADRMKPDETHITHFFHPNNKSLSYCSSLHWQIQTYQKKKQIVGMNVSRTSVFISFRNLFVFNYTSPLQWIRYWNSHM
jgi:hypothetical protein